MVSNYTNTIKHLGAAKLIQGKVYQPDRIGQPFFSTPKVTIRKNLRSPILSYGGIVLARDLMARLEVAKCVDESIALLKMHEKCSWV